MSKILEDLINNTKSLPIDDQLKQICDQIQKEENDTNNNVAEYIFRPQGPNIFLSILIPKITGAEVCCFVCLEREFPGVYIVSLWTKMNDKGIGIVKSIRRSKTWAIKEHEAKKILEEYAKLLNFMRGK